MTGPNDGLGGNGPPSFAGGDGGYGGGNGGFGGGGGGGYRSGGGGGGYSGGGGGGGLLYGAGGGGGGSSFLNSTYNGGFRNVLFAADVSGDGSVLLSYLGPIAPVPEPGAALAIGTALAGLAMARRRRR